MSTGPDTLTTHVYSVPSAIFSIYINTTGLLSDPRSLCKSYSKYDIALNSFLKFAFGEAPYKAFLMTSLDTIRLAGGTTGPS